MTYQSVDEYLAAQPPASRSVLERVRATLRKALPRATEGISYQIPIYKLDGMMVLYFAGFKYHYSIYPATARLIGALGKQLAGRVQSKATIRFAYTDPVPARLITRIAKLRAAEAAERSSAKTAKRGAAGKPKPPARKTTQRKR
jgi:uncharacterized protein YdhG (YjbR/CyaY superfamily)